MNTSQSSWFQRYLLPGFVFQSVIIAGGYGTGRELVEFFRAVYVVDENRVSARKNFIQLDQCGRCVLEKVVDIDVGH